MSIPTVKFTGAILKTAPSSQAERDQFFKQVKTMEQKGFNVYSTGDAYETYDMDAYGEANMVVLMHTDDTQREQELVNFAKTSAKTTWQFFPDVDFDVMKLLVELGKKVKLTNNSLTIEREPKSSVENMLLNLWGTSQYLNRTVYPQSYAGHGDEPTYWRDVLTRELNGEQRLFF